MKLIRYQYPETSNPFNELDKFFSNTFGNMGRMSLFPEMFGDIAKATPKVGVDIFEDADHYFARFEVPGYKKEDISVELENRLLTVKGEQKVETEPSDGKEENAEKVRRMENESFIRTVTVSEHINMENISANLENGLLTVTLPKSEKIKPKTIAIK